MDLTIFHNAEAGEQEWSRDRLLSLCRKLKLDPDHLDAKHPASVRRLAAVSGPVAVAGGESVHIPSAARP